MRIQLPPAGNFTPTMLQGAFDQLMRLLNGNLGSDNIADGSIAFVDLAAETYDTYTPTWTATGTSPSIGDGTIFGRYKKIGKTVVFFIGLLPGSATTFGTGGWSFSLPVTARGTQELALTNAIDTSAGSSYSGTAITRTTTVDVWSFIASTAGQIQQTTNAIPFTWANGDSLAVYGSYEAA